MRAKRRSRLSMGVGHVPEEHVRQAAGRHDAEGVAVQPGVLGRDPALLAAEADAHGAALVLEPAQPGAGLGRRLRALRRLVRGQVADAPQDVVQRVGVPRPQLLGAVLQVVLHLLQRAGVDEVAQLLLPQQLAQQLAVQRQRHRAPLGRRRVALVHVGRHVIEEQRRGERRGGLRLHLDDADLAGVRSRAAAPGAPARRARRAGTRDRSRGSPGTADSAAPPRAGDCALRRCCQRGVRRPG